MPDERPTTDEPTPVRDPIAERARQPQTNEPLAEHDAWPDEADELPPRPRRRVLTPLPLALLAALAIALGFIAGVLVEKGQGGGSASGVGAGGAFASRLAALRGGTSSGGAAAGSSGGGSGRASGSSTGSGSTGSAASSSTRGPAGAGGTGGGGSATIGQVAYASKGTLYVTTSEGNTVKVTAAPGASVTKTVKASVKGIHPGETVVVAGTSGSDGAIAASSIRIGSAAGGLGGGAALGGAAGGAGASGAGASRSSGTSSGGATSGSGEPQLFGKG